MSRVLREKDKIIYKLRMSFFYPAIIICNYTPPLRLIWSYFIIYLA